MKRLLLVLTIVVLTLSGCGNRVHEKDTAPVHATVEAESNSTDSNQETEEVAESDDESEMDVPSIIKKGIGYMGDYEFSKAENCFNKAMKSDPEQAYLYLIELEIFQNHFNNAEKLANEALEKIDSKVIQDKLDMLQYGKVIDYQGNERKSRSYHRKSGIFEKYRILTYDKDGVTSAAMFDSNDRLLDIIDFTQCRPYETKNLHFGSNWNGDSFGYALTAVDSEQRIVYSAWLYPDGTCGPGVGTFEYSEDGSLTTRYNWIKNPDSQEYELTNVEFSKNLGGEKNFEYRHVPSSYINSSGISADDSRSQDKVHLNWTAELEEGRVRVSATYHINGELYNHYYTKQGPITLTDEELDAQIAIPTHINVSDYFDVGLIDEDSFPDSPDSIIKQYNIAEQYDLKRPSAYPIRALCNKSEYSACDILIENTEQVIKLPEEYDKPSVQAVAAYLKDKTGSRISVVEERADTDLRIVVKDDADNTYTIVYNAPFQTAYLLKRKNADADNKIKLMNSALITASMYLYGQSEGLDGYDLLIPLTQGVISTNPNATILEIFSDETQITVEGYNTFTFSNGLLANVAFEQTMPGNYKEVTGGLSIVYNSDGEFAFMPKKIVEHIDGRENEINKSVYLHNAFTTDLSYELSDSTHLSIAKVRSVTLDDHIQGFDQWTEDAIINCTLNENGQIVEINGLSVTYNEFGDIISIGQHIFGDGSSPTSYSITYEDAPGDQDDYSLTFDEYGRLWAIDKTQITSFGAIGLIESDSSTWTDEFTFNASFDYED